MGFVNGDHDTREVSSEHLTFAYYVTGHGFGHATRAAEAILDCGAVQADALTVDRLASLEKYQEVAMVPRATLLATEVKWLHSIKADLVVSDAVPVACRAAVDAGIRSWNEDGTSGGRIDRRQQAKPPAMVDLSREEHAGAVGAVQGDNHGVQKRR
ncbi:L-arabinokinase [Apostasia shenzhenica]|uniref:L-arabinokinase n=1 Tax=Apostasia shenzhenica TaxID=1088818 RepID=A0A2H9ZYD1_9ASPA|nr:L-arabinokinase [Apostasia shenzhenica]